MLFLYNSKTNCWTQQWQWHKRRRGEIETTAECVHMSPRTGGFHKQTQHACCFWHSEVVNKGTLNTEALQEWWIYQDNRKSVGVRGSERETPSQRERESPLGFAVPVQGCNPPFLPPALLAPRSSGTSQTWADATLPIQSLNPNTQMCTYIFLSLQLSFFSHSFPPYNSLSAHPQGKAWIWSRQPKKHMQTLFLRVCLSLKCGTGGLRCYVYLFIYLFIWGFLDYDINVCCDVLSLLSYCYLYC